MQKTDQTTTTTKKTKKRALTFRWFFGQFLYHKLILSNTTAIRFTNSGHLFEAWSCRVGLRCTHVVLGGVGRGRGEHNLFTEVVHELSGQAARVWSLLCTGLVATEPKEVGSKKKNHQS